MPLVNVVALALEIRPEIAANLRTFVPIEPEPAQPVVDRRGRFLGVARLVRILDAQDERAAVMPREEPVEQRGARAADVQIAGGRWSEANADGEFMRKRFLAQRPQRSQRIFALRDCCVRISFDEQLPVPGGARGDRPAD